MGIMDMFSPDACNISGMHGATSWNWEQYFAQKEKIEKEGGKIFLLDMINHPVEGSTPISNEIFQNQPDGTHFVLYCHSGGSSGYLQKQLTPQFPQYNIINLAGGIGMYPNT